MGSERSSPVLISQQTTEHNGPQRPHAVAIDQRSAVAAQYRALYRDQRWRGKDGIRAKRLAMEPSCRRCLAKGIRTNATVADHIVRHFGVEALFFDIGNTQSLCVPCHNRDKQSIERIGFDKTIGEDGWPADPAHPVNAGTTPQPYSIPHYLQQSAIPVHLVCGAPGSGKTTFVRANASPGDTIIDFDDIRQSIGAPRYSEEPSHLAAAFAIRDRMLRALSKATKGQAWLIVMAPTRYERDAWVKALGNVEVHSIDTPPAECKQRIMADHTRVGATDRLIAAVDRYFKARNGR